MGNRKGDISFGLSEFILILLAIFFGIIIFAFLTKSGGFFDKIEEVGCDIANTMVSVLKIFGTDVSVC